MPEILRGVGVLKILTFYIYEGVFGKLKNRRHDSGQNITFIMRSAHRVGSLTRKQIQGKSA
ncbi:hypothetical protein E2C01_006118 [Portunus trituberculatus]|uniref:Uncharacterized protein n=1 Tax=Portunus trituberculatus TaxID=210409 RepID=A0A5B7CYE8_PORTR|nr:hypothetical protein [Portunus trituberculatus]